MSIVWQDNVTPLDAPHLNLLEQTARKGTANGYASLDGGTKVPVAQLPDLSGSYQPLSQKAQANGYASLDAGGKIPAAQLPAGADLSVYQLKSEKGQVNGYLGLDASKNVALTASQVIVWSAGVSLSQRVVPAGARPDGNTLTVPKSNTGLYAAYELVSNDGFVNQVWMGESLIGGSYVPAVMLAGTRDGSSNPVWDVNLYRSQAGVLKTDGAFFAGSTVYANQGTANQVIAGYNGSAVTAGFALGPGGGGDTNLYRASAAVLQTDGAFVSGGTGSKRVELSVDRLGGGQAAINFGGPTPDTNLYRPQAGVLKTDNLLYVGSNAYTNVGKAAQIGLVDFQAAGTPMIVFGSASDANLYRSAANELKTDGAFKAGGEIWARPGAAAQVVIGSNVGGNAGIYFGSAFDVNLYRFLAGYLKTDQNLLVASALAVNHNDGSGKLYFGSGTDTSLCKGAGQSPWGAGVLADPHLYCSNDVISRVGTANMVQIGYVGGGAPGVSFGNAGDTLLFRAAATTLALHSGSVYGTHQAAAFTVSSARRLKREIEKAEPLHDELLSAGVYRYRREGSETRHLGLMADELPAASESGEFVDLYALCAALVQTVQHLNGRLSALEAA